MGLAAAFFVSAIEALAKKPSGSKNSFSTVAKSVVRYPIKAIAAFVMAPFLAFRVARGAKSSERRIIASVGLFLAIVFAWLAGTFLGTAAGALLILLKVGTFWGLAFFIGTALSVTLSVAFSILVLNATAWIFLHMSSEEVVAYLRDLSKE